MVHPKIEDDFLLSILGEPKPTKDEFNLNIAEIDEFGKMKVKFSEPIIPYINLDLLNNKTNEIIDLLFWNGNSEEFDENAIIDWQVISIDENYMEI